MKIQFGAMFTIPGRGYLHASETGHPTTMERLLKQRAKEQNVRLEIADSSEGMTLYTDKEAIVLRAYLEMASAYEKAVQELFIDTFGLTRYEEEKALGMKRPAYPKMLNKKSPVLQPGLALKALQEDRFDMKTGRIRK